MSKIAYDPVKDLMAGVVRRSSILRTFFYQILDLVFLRSWHIRSVLRELCRPLEKKGEWKLLDAGSGFGQYDRFILKHFKNVKVTSIDIKENYLDDSRAYFSNQIASGRISFDYQDLLNFQTDELFDVVICIDVLEHIGDDLTAIRNISNSLVKGGYFLMHSPSHYSEEDADEDDTFVDEHARTGYSKEEIEQKLMRLDLLPLKTHYTYGKWGRRGWVLLVKWPMLLFTRLHIFAILPLIIYYPLVIIPALLMNGADLFTRNYKGNGIYALAKKI
ncbi:MAG: class I SAM-dependent methyltransferase [Balneolaceae bacterium]|nr:MAG: class I SAM-dependent methyltransferase [Balneolaceae bacterium]